MNIYVGNLSFEVTDDELRQLFAAYGEVESASVVKDRFSGESRGFGFVEMPAKKDADAAIAALNGTDVKGRSITVNEAKPKAPKKWRRRWWRRPGWRSRRTPVLRSSLPRFLTWRP